MLVSDTCDFQYKEDKFYESRMTDYYNEAVDAFSRRVFKNAHKFAYCVAESFIQGEIYAEDIFADLGLKTIHCYALLSDDDDFRDELNNLIANDKE